MTDTDTGTGHDAGRSDGTESATARLLFAGTAATVLLRGVIWALSSLTIGPLFGLLDLLLGRFSTSTVVLGLQAVATVAAVIIALVCAAGLRNEPGRFRRPVRILSWVFVADVVVYLAPVVLIVAISPALNGLAWTLFALAAAGNLALGWLALIIGRRTRPLPAPSAE
jgi:hypothetical protein